MAKKNYFGHVFFRAQYRSLVDGGVLMNTIVGEAGLVMAIKGYDDYQVCTSSHTLLIYLSPSGSFNGGATRLFLSGKYDQVQIYSYRANITGSKDISSLFPGYNTQNVFLFFPY